MLIIRFERIIFSLQKRRLNQIGPYELGVLTKNRTWDGWLTASCFASKLSGHFITLALPRIRHEEAVILYPINVTGGFRTRAHNSAVVLKTTPLDHSGTVTWFVLYGDRTRDLGVAYPSFTKVRYNPIL